MNTVKQIIAKAGLDISDRKAWAISIDNPPYMRLAVEAIGTIGISTTVSVAHYGEQNGDAMRDPEIVFVVDQGKWTPVYFRNDYFGVEEGNYWENERLSPKKEAALMDFCRIWDKNIRQQGFLDCKFRVIKS